MNENPKPGVKATFELLEENCVCRRCGALVLLRHGPFYGPPYDTGWSAKKARQMDTADPGGRDWTCANLHFEHHRLRDRRATGVGS